MLCKIKNKYIHLLIKHTKNLLTPECEVTLKKKKKKKKKRKKKKRSKIKKWNSEALNYLQRKVNLIQANTVLKIPLSNNPSISKQPFWAMIDQSIKNRYRNVPSGSLGWKKKKWIRESYCYWC